MFSTAYAAGLDFESSGQSIFGSAGGNSGSVLIGPSWSEAPSLGPGISEPTIDLGPLGEIPLGSYGWILDLVTSGAFGFDLGYEADGGELAAHVSGTATATFPDRFTVAAGQSFSIDPDEAVTSAGYSAGALDLDLFVDFAFAIAASVVAQIAVFAPSDRGEEDLFDVSFSTRLLSLSNEGVTFDFLEPLIGDAATRPAPEDGNGLQIDIEKTTGDKPFSIKVQGTQVFGPSGVATRSPLLEADVDFPSVGQSATLSNGTVSSSSTEQVIDLDVVLTNLQTLAGFPGMSTEVNFLGIKILASLFEATGGPIVDLVQSFSLLPETDVHIAFSEDVLLGGTVTREYLGAWSAMPDITLLSEVTTLTPTFVQDARFSTDIDLDVGLDLDLGVLAGSLEIPVFGLDEGFGPLFSFDASTPRRLDGLARLARRRERHVRARRLQPDRGAIRHSGDGRKLREPRHRRRRQRRAHRRGRHARGRRGQRHRRHRPGPLPERLRHRRLRHPDGDRLRAHRSGRPGDARHGHRHEFRARRRGWLQRRGSRQPRHDNLRPARRIRPPEGRRGRDGRLRLHADRRWRTHRHRHRHGDHHRHQRPAARHSQRGRVRARRRHHDHHGDA